VSSSQAFAIVLAILASTSSGWLHTYGAILSVAFLLLDARARGAAVRQGQQDGGTDGR
jgi:hypothetical protein